MTEALTLTDATGDDLEVHTFADALVLLAASDKHDTAVCVSLDRPQALDLYHALGNHLLATNPNVEHDDTCVHPPVEGDGQGREWCQDGHRVDNLPDAEADGYAWPTEAESILRDAHDATHGRDDQYGHPRGTLTVTAQFWTVALQHKMRDGAYVEPEDVARCQIGTKLARDLHTPKRDNRVDIAGYAETLDRLETGQ